jgi:hypothetical protein
MLFYNKGSKAAFYSRAMGPPFDARQHALIIPHPTAVSSLAVLLVGRTETRAQNLLSQDPMAFKLNLSHHAL